MSVATRLERLPFSPFHFNLLCIGGLGFAFEAVGAAIIAFLMPVLRNLWHLTSAETGVLGSSTYVGFLIGALCAGLLGDRLGRRTVMMWALVLFCRRRDDARTQSGNVLVEDRFIRDLEATVRMAEGRRIIDLNGLTLMPGLIDCHVHVVASMTGQLYTWWWQMVTLRTEVARQWPRFAPVELNTTPLVVSPAPMAEA